MSMPDISQKIINQYFIQSIESYLKSGKIQPNDSLDKVRAVLRSDPIFKSGSSELNIDIVITYKEELLKSVNLELEHKHYHQAIIISLTYIEHTLNELYIDYMTDVLSMSNAQVDTLLKCNGLSEKMAGLFYLTFRENFPSDLKTSIEKIKKFRNNFIHYKFRSIPVDELDIDDSFDNPITIAQSLLPILQELNDFINSLTCRLYPNKKIAQDIAKQILGAK